VQAVQNVFAVLDGTEVDPAAAVNPSVLERK